MVPFVSIDHSNLSNQSLRPCASSHCNIATCTAAEIGLAARSMLPRFRVVSCVQFLLVLKIRRTTS